LLPLSLPARIRAMVSKTDKIKRTPIVSVEGSRAKTLEVGLGTRSSYLKVDYGI
jgi:hypothetical protein